jgi:hypothetical protein
MTQQRTSRIAFVTIAGAGLLLLGVMPAAARTGDPAAAPGVATAAPQTGQPGLAERVPRSIAPPQPGASATAASSARPHGRRLLPRTSTALGVASAAVPTAPATAGSATAAANALLTSFNGTSSLDSQVTNFNQKFEPPDQGLCAGAGFILEPVNSAYRIFRTNGQSIRGPFNVNDLFNEGAKEFTTDPRCWYDPATHTWFATIAFLNDTFTEGRIDIAVNPNSDPTGLWTEYQIDATFDGRNGEPNLPGCPCFGDQPRLGIDQTNLYVTTDEFSINGPEFFGGQIYAISKADLVAGVASPHFVRFGNLQLGGAITGAPQPALSIGTPDAEYFLSQLDSDGTGDNRIGVWAMTQRDKVATGGSPKLSKMVIRSEPYSTPPPADQRGSTSQLDSGDDRMQQASFVGGTVWGELGTGLRPAGDASDRAGLAWFQVRPRLAGAAIAGATIVRQGYVAKTGESLLYPAVQPDAAGNAAMVFTQTGKNRFPSAAYSVLKAGDANFGPSVIAAAGHGPYDHAATRWGDYSFAVPDWGHASAWLATEYIPPSASQTSTGERNWGTQVFNVSLG